MADGFIKTKCSSSGIKKPLEFQCVKYEPHQRKKKLETVESKTPRKEVNIFKNQKNLLNLKKVRHEVIKFGISGFDAPKKEEAKIALAVSLGAKPPRREYLNYKDLMEQKKKQNKERKDMLNQMQTGKDSMLKVQKNGRKTDSIKKGVTGSGNLLNAYGKVNKKQLKQVRR